MAAAAVCAGYAGWVGGCYAGGVPSVVVVWGVVASPCAAVCVVVSVCVWSDVGGGAVCVAGGGGGGAISERVVGDGVGFVVVVVVCVVGMVRVVDVVYVTMCVVGCGGRGVGSRGRPFCA